MLDNLHDFRTDQEKKQDAFENLLKNADVGTVAKIRFEGNIFQVEKVESLDLKISRLKIIGKKHGFDGEALTFDINVVTDAELLEVLKF